jgi:hypothetical protein
VVFGWLRRLFERQQPPSIRDELKNLGLNVLSDRNLEQRLRVLNTLHDFFDKPIEEHLKELKIPEPTPLDKLNVEREILKAMNRCMKLTAVPYGRAGDVDAYREAMKGWEMLYHIAWDILDTVERSIKTYQERENALKIDAEDMAQKAWNFLKIEVFPYGMMIINFSFFSRDVAPSYAAIVQQLPQYGFGPPVRQYDTGSPAEQDKTSQYTGISLPDKIKKERPE